jgi:hypothetical protein
MRGVQSRAADAEGLRSRNAAVPHDREVDDNLLQIAVALLFERFWPFIDRDPRVPCSPPRVAWPSTLVRAAVRLESSTTAVRRRLKLVPKA